MASDYAFNRIHVVVVLNGILGYLQIRVGLAVVSFEAFSFFKLKVIVLVAVLDSYGEFALYGVLNIVVELGVSKQLLIVGEDVGLVDTYSATLMVLEHAGLHWVLLGDEWLNDHIEVAPVVLNVRHQVFFVEV